MFVSQVLGSLPGLELVVAQAQAVGWVVVGIENHKPEQVEVPADERAGQRSLGLVAVFEVAGRASVVVAQYRPDKLIARIDMIVFGKADSARAERLLWSEIRAQDASHYDQKNTTGRF